MNKEPDIVIEDMKARVRTALVTLNTYRASHPHDVRIESILEQVEFVQDTIESGRSLSYAQKDALTFNLVEGTPLERNDKFVTELYSIRNFAQNSL